MSRFSSRRFSMRYARTFAVGLLLSTMCTVATPSVAEPKNEGAQPVPKKVAGFSGPPRWERVETAVQIGDIVEWSVGGGTHGVMFNDWGKAQQVLEPVGGLTIGPQPGFAAPAQGTEARAGAGTLLLRARVKAVPAGMTEVP